MNALKKFKKKKMKKKIRKGEIFMLSEKQLNAIDNISEFISKNKTKQIEISKDMSEYEESLDILRRMAFDFKDLRNEFCYHCGRYRTAHLGSCKGCRWSDEK